MSLIKGQLKRRLKELYENYENDVWFPGALCIPCKLHVLKMKSESGTRMRLPEITRFVGVGSLQLSDVIVEFVKLREPIPLIHRKLDMIILQVNRNQSQSSGVVANAQNYDRKRGTPRLQ
ncbi:hypothetical protein QAD02_002495 [Eretmocerus hayati]|uniref:Uncharacterized protein n=1 Tax=Eretmocerus hayati TaxID=131215 RepID=A0ACC2NJZ8_9HYME|nr:hypothetical protein QAD02_002495 [Eretmocerus hayati]